ncbi:hypothetical protein KXD93_26415 [Mucilaginibacter sp. BJC16-A38]|uniref:hypothetical protein n=1 Tax=Mucilaginibacter phenanthrenivorans TaxID=1234842 RepID=UPI002157301F|nr:hypothetical protein [Mucilaginibacter phenanthrenivorans]MCR8561215.1 hypothetical protein [Mucilaginibacter phenanthrenivorans]
MDYSKLSKKDLVAIIDNVRKVLDGLQSNDIVNYDEKKQSDDNPLESLIGTIPFLLTNKDLFEKNQDIADFATRLDIFIPSAEKKKREDIIGRVILAISNFDKNKIEDLNIAIKSIKGSDSTKSDKSNFFKDWELMIRKIKI